MTWLKSLMAAAVAGAGLMFGTAGTAEAQWGGYYYHHRPYYHSYHYRPHYRSHYYRPYHYGHHHPYWYGGDAGFRLGRGGFSIWF